MNKALALLLVLVVISVSIVSGNNASAQTANETQVTFSDANLEAAIRDAIDKPEGPIFTSDFEGLTSLEASGKLGEYTEHITDLTGLEYCINLTELDLGENQISDISPLLSPPNLKTLLILNDNPLNETSLNVYIPQLKKGGVSIPRKKHFISVGRGEFLLVPLIAFIAALVVTLRFYPTRRKRWRRLVKSGLIVGVVFTGLYTLYGTAEILFGGVYLEDLLFEVWLPGLAFYVTIVVVAVITNVIAKKKA